jgi:CTP synthase (UTP-ammonia lyase)
MTISIVLLGEYDPAFEPHRATDAAIAHSSAALGRMAKGHWISTAEIDAATLARHQGLWVAPGSPYKDLPRTLESIRFAREQKLPCLGTCGGFQHMVLEYARNELGMADAQHAEYDSQAANLFVSRLECSLIGRELAVKLAPGSLVARCYGATSAAERYYCNFGVHPDRAAELGSRDLRIVGSDAEGLVRIVELPGHPFFVGTLFVPQARSRPDAPHPLVSAFLRAAAGRSPSS